MFGFIPFQFNIHSSLLLPLVIQGLVYTILLLWRGFKENRLSDKLLAFLILLLTIRVANWMLGFANWYDSHDGFTTFMFYFSWSNDFAYGPLIWLYFRSLTNHGFKLGKKEYLHFIPFLTTLSVQFIVFGIDIVINHWIKGEPLPYFYGTRGYIAETGLGILDDIELLLANLSVLGYFTYTIYQYRVYKNYLNENFSETRNISFPWLRNFLIAFLVGLLIWMVFLVLEITLNMEVPYTQKWYGHFMWGIIIYYLSIGGFSAHPYFQIPLKFNPTSRTNSTKQGQAEPEETPWRNILLNHIEKHQSYLNPQLTLSDLAKELNTTPAIISKTINGCFRKNFNDFINARRVEAVKQKLTDQSLQHLSLLGIALESGFNSKATFNRAFKKHTQLSPTEYLKTQIKP